jgi:hypothetical protein
MMATAPKMVHCSALPHIKTRGIVKNYVDAITKNQPEQLYNAEWMGSVMERLYATTDEAARYERAKSTIVNVDYFGDFTLDMLFRMMNIRETVDERMAMEIAEFIRLYLPQRTFTKVPITVDSVDSDGNHVKKVLEVKLYYAYEADAVQWLIKVFFNMNDLIDERHQQMNANITHYEVLEALKGENEQVNAFFFGSNKTMNIYNHITFQNEMICFRFPTEFGIFRYNRTMDDFQLYSCAGIFTMFMERFTHSPAYCS